MITKRNATLFLVLINISVCLAQGKLSPTKLNAKQLPEGIEYEGKVKSALQWKDANGDNILITTETGIYTSKKFKHEDDGRDAELFAYHYIMKGGKPLQTWKVYDYISDCPLDIEANFVSDPPNITDLDNDGFAEVWMVYKTACRGDVSPADMKLIMYENGKKHAMRGTEKMLQGVDEKGNKSYDGGTYKFDPAFTNAPESFRVFAKKLWKENLYFVPSTGEPKKL
ncbi:M949_RS01915 family surface polysaccharide biosynthesis protein [Flavobacterium album]|nr:hypothetical protein [Flavobacterium album]